MHTAWERDLLPLPDQGLDILLEVTRGWPPNGMHLEADRGKSL